MLLTLEEVSEIKVKDLGVDYKSSLSEVDEALCDVLKPVLK